LHALNSASKPLPHALGFLEELLWVDWLLLCGGETGIRTLDTLRYTRFPSVRLQPLGHLSAPGPAPGPTIRLYHSVLALGPAWRCLESTQLRLASANIKDVSASVLLPRIPAQQTLLIDADDTLWENNIYFERAISAFISYLDHQVHTADEVRTHLNRFEYATISQHGYGLRSFRRSLLACFEHLSQSSATPAQQQRIRSFAESIAEAEHEQIPGVAETLAELSTRHRLLLVTKGDTTEQTGKLERSGLARHFSAVEVLAEKHVAAYCDLQVAHDFDRRSTWMIGNSPRSDINPALAAGLNAVYIQHHSTWVLEDEALNLPGTSQTLLQLKTFPELLEHF
jgi:putative hydrolase of the HAD superfamily